MATLPAYVSAEACAAAFDVKASAYLLPRLTRLAQVASRTIDRACNRQFYPRTGTLTWRPRARSGPTLWFPDDALAVTAVDFDDSAVTGYVLEPRQSGPPYWYMDLTDATGGGAAVVTLTGRFGFSETVAAAGTLASSPDSDDTTVDVSDSSLVGTGDLLLMDSEQVCVTGRSLLTTGTTLSGNPTSSNSDTTIGVASGPAVHAGETVTVDSERMLVLDVAGNNLLVRRAVEGSVLAAHTSSTTVYAHRRLTVERAAVGTTAASHTSSTACYRNTPPALVTEWALAMVQTLFGQETAGWNLTVGEGEAARESSGRGLRAVEKEALLRYRRHNHGAI